MRSVGQTWGSLQPFKLPSSSISTINNIHAFFSGILQAPIAYLNHSKKMSLRWNKLVLEYYLIPKLFSQPEHLYGSQQGTEFGTINFLPSHWNFTQWYLQHFRNLETKKTFERRFNCRCYFSVQQTEKWLKYDHSWVMTPTFNISTSKAHLSMWRVLKRTSAVFLFSSWRKRIEIS